MNLVQFYDKVINAVFPKQDRKIQTESETLFPSPTQMLPPTCNHVFSVPYDYT